MYFLLALSAILPVTAGQNPDRIELVLSGLELDLRPVYGKGQLQGTATLTLHNAGRAPVSRVPLLLNRLMRVSRLSGTNGLRAWNQDVAQFADDSTWQVNAVTVELAQPIRPGDSAAVTVTYRGHLVGYTETGSLYIRDRVDSAFTILREDAFAFPVLGEPSWRTNRSITRRPFRFRATVRVPSGQVVAMGGEEVATRSDGREIESTWQSREPVPFLNIAIAPYRLLVRGGIRIFHFPEDSTGAATLAAAVTGALRQLQGWHGPLQSEARLTIMEIPNGWGSQASLSAGIIQTADAFRDRSELRQVYHELSHLWNPPDLDLASPRWNEGLATFLQWRLAQELDGWDDWTGVMERAGRNLLDRCARNGRCEMVAPAAFGRENMTDFSYQTGFMLFRALFEMMGAARFDSTYRALLETHRTGIATEQLSAAFSEADTRASAVFADWMWSPRWIERLRAGESPVNLIRSYVRPRGG